MSWFITSLHEMSYELMRTVNEVSKLTVVSIRPCIITTKSAHCIRPQLRIDFEETHSVAVIFFLLIYFHDISHASSVLGVWLAPHKYEHKKDRGKVRALFHGPFYVHTCMACSFYKFVYPISFSSTALAASRPSLIAHTTRD